MKGNILGIEPEGDERYSLARLAECGYSPRVAVTGDNGLDYETQKRIAMFDVLSSKRSEIAKVFTLNTGAKILCTKEVDSPEKQKPTHIRTNFGEKPLEWQGNHAIVDCKSPKEYERLVLAKDQPELQQPWVLYAATEHTDYVEDTPRDMTAVTNRIGRFLSHETYNESEEKQEYVAKKEGMDSFYRALASGKVDSPIAREIHEHNQGVIAELEQVRIQSGGRFVGLTSENEYSKYHDKLNPFLIDSKESFEAFVPAVVKAEDLQLSFSKKAVEAVRKDNPNEVEIGGITLPVRYFIGESKNHFGKNYLSTSENYVAALCFTLEQAYEIEPEIFEDAVLPSRRQLEFTVAHEDYKDLLTDDLISLREAIEERAWTLFQREHPEEKIDVDFEADELPTLPPPQRYHPYTDALAYPFIGKADKYATFPYCLKWTLSKQLAEEVMADLRQKKESLQPSLASKHFDELCYSTTKLVFQIPSKTPGLSDIRGRFFEEIEAVKQRHKNFDERNGDPNDLQPGIQNLHEIAERIRQFPTGSEQTDMLVADDNTSTEVTEEISHAPPQKKSSTITATTELPVLKPLSEMDDDDILEEYAANEEEITSITSANPDIDTLLQQLDAAERERSELAAELERRQREKDKTRYPPAQQKGAFNKRRVELTTLMQEIESTLQPINQPRRRLAQLRQRQQDIESL